MSRLSPFLTSLNRALAQQNREMADRIHRPAGDESHPCSDCGAPFARISTPVAGGRWYCDEDWRWRERRMLQFDARSRRELDARARPVAS